MPVAQNGYSANDRSLIVSYDVPGGRIALRRGPAGELLAEAVRRWHHEVERLVWPGVWGYAERPIRGSTTVLSNHAAGLGADCNAPAHPLGTNPAANMTPAEIAAVRRIVAESDGCLRWGGDYTGRKDPMHLEIVRDEASCARVLARWRGASAPAVAPARPASGADGLPTLSHGQTSDAVRRLQAFLRRAFPAYGGDLPATGFYGDQTAGVLAEFQRRTGITGPDANGRTVGPRTKRALWDAGYRG
jgi:hypothetical protein